jgi:HSP20 family protein
MAEDKSKVPVQTEKSGSLALHPFRPFEDLRREIDRLFDDFGMWRSPFPRSFFGMEPLKGFQASPAVDVTETDKAYEITAELPGLDEKNIDVKLANGMLTIRGEKQDEREEKKANYYRRERSFGSFERSFQMPDGVDLDKVDAKFNKGIVTVTLPKTAEAQKAEKKITVKTG